MPEKERAMGSIDGNTHLCGMDLLVGQTLVILESKGLFKILLVDLKWLGSHIRVFIHDRHMFNQFELSSCTNNYCINVLIQLIVLNGINLSYRYDNKMFKIY